MEIKCPECSSPEPMWNKKRQVHVCVDCSHEFTVEKPFVPYRVFISYGHDEHASLALRLRDDLRERGHEAWFDDDLLMPGHDWESHIEEGLQWAAAGKPNAAVALLLTPHSVRRPDGYCLNEVARALILGLRIIPLMVVESEPPLSICRIQWLDMRECIPIHEKEALYAPRFERFLAALEQGKLDFEGVQSRLLRVLQPIHFSADLLKLLRDFTGRQWVFDEVDTWFANPAGAKVFWLTGAPGVGKSAIAAWIREHRREVAAFHFCDIYSEEKRNPAKLVCSIVYQLTTQLPEYEARLARLDLESIVQEYHEAYTLFDKLLVQLLADAFPVPDRPIVVLIDALDEATSDRRNEIVRFLSQCADKTPPWMRFLVTSRPEPEITASFQALSPYILDTSREENINDLRRYLIMGLPGITPEQTGEILRRSEGVFLYVIHVMEAIRGETLSLQRMEEFPRGLGDVYQRYFDRQFGKDLTYYESKITPILQPIFAAYEPLTLNHLKRICDITDDTELLRRLNRLGSLFPTSGEGETETIRPFHRSLCDWITDRNSAGHFVIAISDGRRILAEHCWREFQHGLDALSPYALRYLPAHLCAAERWDDLIGNETNPGPLTDLRYIEAKCTAGLTHDLVRDYNSALTDLPEFREENERLQRRDEAMHRYNQALRDYAVKHYDWLQSKDSGELVAEPEYPPLPPELQIKAEMEIPEEHSPRAARLRHFANFVSGHMNTLAAFPRETLPLAFNYAENGPVHDLAKRHIDDRKLPFLKRSPRPPMPPFQPQCMQTLEGHSGSVESVCVCPDGRRAVSASWGITLRIWDLQSGQCLQTLVGHISRVYSVYVCPDGRHAVSASDDNTLRIWDLESGQCLQTLECYRNHVDSVSVCPDGRRVVSASADNTLRIWDLQSGQCLLTLVGDDSPVTSVCVCPDGRRAVSASADNTLRIWDLQSGQCLQTLECDSSQHSQVSVCVCPDGRRAVSASAENTLRIWDLQSGQYLQTLEGHTDSVYSVCVCPDGRRAVSASWDKTLRIWDLENGQCLQTLVGHSSGVHSVCVCPDGRRAVSASWDKTLRIWDLENGQCLQTLEFQSFLDGSVCVCPDGRRAVLTSDYGVLRIWDLQSGEILAIYCGSAVSMTLSPAGDHIICGTADGQVHFLTLVNFPPSGPAIITAINSSKARCPYCSKEFVPPLDVANAINAHADFSDPQSEILSACPNCGKTLKYNPFFIHTFEPTQIR